MLRAWIPIFNQSTPNTNAPVIKARLLTPNIDHAGLHGKLNHSLPVGIGFLLSFRAGIFEFIEFKIIKPNAGLIVCHEGKEVDGGR